MKKLVRQAVKTIFFLTVFTIVCGFLVRNLTDSETLSDYAKDNPEQAYGYVKDESVSNPADSEEFVTGTEEDSVAEASTDSVTGADSEAGLDAESMMDTGAASADRIIYQENFYYEPLSDEVKAKITGTSYPAQESEAVAIAYDDLRHLHVLHYDFGGNVQTGELICNQAIAQDLTEIFYELYLEGYQIEKIRLIDEYQNDDMASMRDNNTYCFSYRTISGSDTLSNHAYGCAVDINPFYNPNVVVNKADGTTTVYPDGSDAYADRAAAFAHKIDKDDLCYQLFTEHGFTWGGSWSSNKDYQHFEKSIE